MAQRRRPTPELLVIYGLIAADSVNRLINKFWEPHDRRALSGAAHTLLLDRATAPQFWLAVNIAGSFWRLKKVNTRVAKSSERWG